MTFALKVDPLRSTSKPITGSTAKLTQLSVYINVRTVTLVSPTLRQWVQYMFHPMYVLFPVTFLSPKRLITDFSSRQIFRCTNCHANISSTFITWIVKICPSVTFCLLLYGSIKTLPAVAVDGRAGQCGRCAAEWPRGCRFSPRLTGPRGIAPQLSFLTETDRTTWNRTPLPVVFEAVRVEVPQLLPWHAPWTKGLGKEKFGN